MNTVKISTTQNIELEYDLAGLGERIVGWIIDWLILGAYLFIMLTIFMSSGILGGMMTFITIPIFFYDLTMEVFMNGQSIGKRVMNIKVISLDGNQPTLGQYLIRWLMRLVDIAVTIGSVAFISIAVSEKKQRLGDMVAGTTLIKTTVRVAFQQTIYVPTHHPDYAVSFPDVATLADKDMQLIKEVIMVVNKTGNSMLALQAAEKIKETLQIQTNMEPVNFLRILLSDYNYITSKE
ncbi:MAG: RDD family protein [Chitinophagaceae bacterium]